MDDAQVGCVFAQVEAVVVKEGAGDLLADTQDAHGDAAFCGVQAQFDDEVVLLGAVQEDVGKTALSADHCDGDGVGDECGEVGKGCDFVALEVVAPDEEVAVQDVE